MSDARYYLPPTGFSPVSRCACGATHWATLASELRLSPEERQNLERDNRAVEHHAHFVAFIDLPLIGSRVYGCNDCMWERYFMQLLPHLVTAVERWRSVQRDRLDILANMGPQTGVTASFLAHYGGYPEEVEAKLAAELEQLDKETESTDD